MKSALSAVALATIALAGIAGCKKGFGSDFEGEVTLRTTRAGGAAQDMIVKAKGDKLRFDTTTNGQSASALRPSMRVTNDQEACPPLGRLPANP